MKTPTNPVARHIIAYFLSFFVVAWVVFCFVTPFISQLLTGTLAKVYLEPPGTFIWCGIYWLWFTFVCLPISAIAERIFLNRHLQWWIQALILFILFLVLGFIGWEIVGFLFSGELTSSAEPLVYAIEGAILGTIYWAILRASTLFFRRKSQNE